MSFWVLMQVMLNIVLLAGVLGLWLRLNRPAKDDPRLSRGLQLLQSKISVLEDLSDRTETQVNQLTQLMEQKVKEIQEQLLQADKTIQNIETSKSRSLEVAKIFQDRIPHQEIIERQQTLKYIKAARMAHSGQSADEIAKTVDLSRGEIEFIAKVNKDQLQFSESELPDWVHENSEAPAKIEEPVVAQQALPKQQDVADLSLSELGNKFRQAIQTGVAAVPANESTVILSKNSQPVIEMPQVQQPMPAQQAATTSSGKSVTVKKVVFPKVEINNNLM